MFSIQQAYDGSCSSSSDDTGEDQETQLGQGARVGWAQVKFVLENTLIEIKNRHRENKT